MHYRTKASLNIPVLFSLFSRIGRDRSSLGRETRFKHHKLNPHQGSSPPYLLLNCKVSSKSTGPKFSKLRFFMHLKLRLKHFQELHKSWQYPSVSACVSKFSSAKTGLSCTHCLCRTHIWHLIHKYTQWMRCQRKRWRWCCSVFSSHPSYCQRWTPDRRYSRWDQFHPLS